MVLIYVLWWEKPFEVDYPTLIQSQNLWDFRALHVMQTNRSPATELINREFRARVESDKRFQALKSIKYVSNRIRAVPLFPSVSRMSALAFSAVFLLRDVNVRSDHLNACFFQAQVGI